MLKHRVIPCLLLRGRGLVKTRKFAAPQYVGDPINAIRIFNEKEADELMVLDISASVEGRGPQFDLIEQFAGECFMPLCYGGGIRTVEQARQLFALGVEKVCLQTAVLNDVSLVTKIAEQFGEQAVLASVDVKRKLFGRMQLYAAASRKILPGPWLDHVRRLVAAGAGEILLNAVDRDGTMEGPDLELIREASHAIAVPLVAVGGVGSLADVRAAVDAGASAVAAGAFFVLHGPHRAVLVTYPDPTELQQIFATQEGRQ
ncbi:MAG TPA: AglZ/HisF2 family acetamidino modification protein [Gemmatimonadaceae bacterium]|nr:AglZ/HisF2 family acetamidino modification protein [Gemmatimonadaceae bacterium]